MTYRQGCRTASGLFGVVCFGHLVLMGTLPLRWGSIREFGGTVVFPLIVSIGLHPFNWHLWFGSYEPIPGLATVFFRIDVGPLGIMWGGKPRDKARNREWAFA